MRHVRVFGVFVGVALLGAAAQSWAGPPICDNAMALRVNQQGLDFITTQVKPLVPDSIDIPPISQMVVDWPLTDSGTQYDFSGNGNDGTNNGTAASTDGPPVANCSLLGGN